MDLVSKENLDKRQEAYKKPTGQLSWAVQKIKKSQIDGKIGLVGTLIRTTEVKNFTFF